MAATDERSSVEGRLRELEQVLAGGSVAPDVQRDIQVERIAVQRALAQRGQVEQQLRLRESEILGVITGEQGRWNDFNARLDELERSLSARRAPVSGCLFPAGAIMIDVKTQIVDPALRSGS